MGLKHKNNIILGKANDYFIKIRLPAIIALSKADTLENNDYLYGK